MWQLMTLQKVKVPPQPQRGQDIAEFFPDYYAPYILTRHEYDPYDLELRVLVSQLESFISLLGRFRASLLLHRRHEPNSYSSWQLLTLKC